MYLEAEQKLRRRIYYLITEKTQKFGEDISEAIAELFARKVKKGLEEFKLDREFGPQAGQQSRVDAIINGIKVSKSTSKKGGYRVTIRNDYEGLLMYIEYGSGWLGDQFKNEGDSDEVGWGYMNNEENYIPSKKHKGVLYFKFDLRHSNSKPPFLTVNDKTMQAESYTETRVHTFKKKSHYGEYKNGDISVRQKKYSKNKRENTIFSRGIKPQFIIFKARREVREFLEKYKTYQELKSALISEGVYGGNSEEQYGD